MERIFRIDHNLINIQELIKFIFLWHVPLFPPLDPRFPPNEFKMSDSPPPLLPPPPKPPDPPVPRFPPNEFNISENPPP